MLTIILKQFLCKYFAKPFVVMQAIAFVFNAWFLYFAECKKVISFSLAFNKSAILCILIFVSGSKEFILPDIAIIFFIEKGPLFLKKKNIIHS